MHKDDYSPSIKLKNTKHSSSFIYFNRSLKQSHTYHKATISHFLLTSFSYCSNMAENSQAKHVISPSQLPQYIIKTCITIYFNKHTQITINKIKSHNINKIINIRLLSFSQIIGNVKPYPNERKTSTTCQKFLLDNLTNTLSAMSYTH